MATFYNMATLSYNNGSVNSNVVSGEIVQVLSVTKTALSATYAPGDIITYVVSLVNTGSTEFGGITLTDNLGAYTLGEQQYSALSYIDDSVAYFVNGTQQTAPTVTSGNTLSITGISVPANGNALLIYRARANEFASPAEDGTITNTVTVTGAGILNSLSAQETVSADTSPRLAISKSLSPSSVSENGTLTYTFVISNLSAAQAVADDNLIVTDTFDPILSNISVSLNGTALTETTDYTYNTATGTFATVGGKITVPAATISQNTETGVWTVTPGTSVLSVSGTI